MSFQGRLLVCIHNDEFSNKVNNYILLIRNTHSLRNKNTFIGCDNISSGWVLYWLFSRMTESIFKVMCAELRI